MCVYVCTYACGGEGRADAEVFKGAFAMCLKTPSGCRRGVLPKEVPSPSKRTTQLKSLSQHREHQFLSAFAAAATAFRS